MALLCLVFGGAALVAGLLAGCFPKAAPVTTNSIGIELVKIPAGSFVMGQDTGGDWDESPAHRVTISKPFFISATEVTLDQFRQFRPDHDAGLEGKAVGVSWYDAVAFCEWLSKKEGKPYRLPTEAEWEYACRAGTATAFWSGSRPPVDAGTPNPWGLRDLYDGTMEWCHDWHGPYRADPQTDPVGPDHGLTRVVRGDKPDDDRVADDPKQTTGPYYHRSANRAGMPPSFGIPGSSSGEAGGKGAFGVHSIGFRVVQGNPPSTMPHPADVPFVCRGIKAPTLSVGQGPPADKPYFRKRYLLPTPPAPSGVEDIVRAGLHPSLRPHNHSPALEVCPNGDLLMITYTAHKTEYEPGVSLIATRLRSGADDWDIPEPMFDLPDANDASPLLWTDWTGGGRMYCFWGSPRIARGAFPFQWVTSDDSGATWSEVHYPLFTGPVGPHSRQPINTAVRGLDGTLYIAADGTGASSVLWASGDNGLTWRDTGSRTTGRHTTFCLLDDGRILGLGGKNSNFEGFMPKVISADGGKTWSEGKSPFSPLASGQRPCVLRLQNGHLFMAGDFQTLNGRRAPGITENGSYVALSDDQGESWHIKRIPVAQPREDSAVVTLGYCVARQAPNGMIHLITSMNAPCLHFELNEAWILSDADAGATDADLMPPKTKSLDDVKAFEERYPSGRIKATWHTGIGNDGRCLLTGDERWYFEDGKKQYEAHHELGRKTGTETLFRPDGSTEWQWDHQPDGSEVWTQFWETGRIKSLSTWRNFLADGPAKRWDRNGNLLSEVTFPAGAKK